MIYDGDLFDKLPMHSDTSLIVPIIVIITLMECSRTKIYKGGLTERALRARYIGKLAYLICSCAGPNIFRRETREIIFVYQGG